MLDISEVLLALRNGKGGCRLLYVLQCLRARRLARNLKFAFNLNLYFVFGVIEVVDTVVLASLTTGRSCS